jgi:acetoin utilization protein AcuB
MHILVRDFMTADPIVIHPDTTLPAAYLLMRINDIRRLPVVNDEGKLVGIVTFGDIREARPQEAASLTSWDLHMRTASLRAQDFMTTGPLTVKPDTEIQEAARLMLDHKLGGLPVVDGGKLVGIITDSDIFRLVVGSGILANVPWDDAAQWGLDAHRELSPG